MNRDAIREFLAGWLMEFGVEPVPYRVLYDSIWYKNHPLGRATESIKPFLTEGRGEHDVYRTWQINQAGLDLLKGDTKDTDNCTCP